jgi:starch phosphorylase
MKSITPRFNAQRMVMDYVNNYYQPASSQGAILLADAGEVAIGLADWKARVRQAWPGVELHVVGCVKSSCPHDGAVELRVEAALNGLSAEDVRVECLVSPECTGTHGSPGPDSFFLDKESEAEGRTVFATRVQPPYPGLQTLRLRMYPYHESLTHPLEMGAMLWV